MPVSPNLRHRPRTMGLTVAGSGRPHCSRRTVSHPEHRRHAVRRLPQLPPLRIVHGRGFLLLHVQTDCTPRSLRDSVNAAATWSGAVPKTHARADVARSAIASGRTRSANGPSGRDAGYVGPQRFNNRG